MNRCRQGSLSSGSLVTPRPTRSVGLYASRWNFNPGFIGDLDGTNWDKAFRASARSNSHDSQIYDSCVAPMQDIYRRSTKCFPDAHLLQPLFSRESGQS